MAELTIDPATIRKALDDFVEAYTPSELSLIHISEPTRP